VKAVILPGGDYCSDYSSKNHGGCRGSRAGGQEQNSLPKPDTRHPAPPCLISLATRT
jgi:hypothetical protein